MNASRQLHVVFGAGQIGAPLARLLRTQGHDVRIVRRAPPPRSTASHS
jgi:predicted dinucleotide-binding enzyme